MNDSALKQFVIDNAKTVIHFKGGRELINFCHREVKISREIPIQYRNLLNNIEVMVSNYESEVRTDGRKG